MHGLFGSLNLGVRSLQAQQMGIEVSGHNLANVNNPAFKRQRVEIETALYLSTPIGPIGTGATATAISQMRDALLDEHIQSEASVSGFYEAQQRALEYAQSALGQEIDRKASGAEGASAANGLSGQYGIAQGLNSLFNSFQSLATDPGSLAERQVLLLKAEALATQFNQTGQRLANLHSSLNDSVRSDLQEANQLLDRIASLNDAIENAEGSTDGKANDLRDERQARLEELAKLVSIDTAETPDGAISVSIGGELVVEGKNVLDTLEGYDVSGGQQVRLQSAGTPLTLTGGRVQGTIEARDNPLASLRQDLDNLAGTLISEVNAIHATGYSLSGATGANFFTGTDAASMRLAAGLAGNPAGIQASAVAGTVGDNAVALELAKLGRRQLAAFNNQTVHENFGQTVASLGQSLASANGQAATQGVVDSMLRRQRDSISGVSLDEEMTDLMKYQKAYQASARFINTIDELMETVLSLKR